MRYITILAFLLFTSNLLKGQESFIKARIINLNKEPISYASIKVKNLGTVSNSNGQFILQIESLNLTDTIIISSIGFESKTILVSELNSKSEQNIFLVPKLIVLNEVIVKNIDALEYLKNAVSMTSFKLVNNKNFESYYKEVIEKDKQLLKFADASFYGFIKNTTISPEVQLKIIESRIKTNSEFENNKIYQAIPMPIRVTLPFEEYFTLDRLAKKIETKEKYDFVYISLNNGFDLVTVTPRGGWNEALSEVKVYVNQNTGEIKRIDYEVLPPQSKFFKKVKILSVSTYVTSSKTIVLYENVNGSIYLNYCNVDIGQFLGTSKEEMNLSFKIECLITNVSIKNGKEIPNSEQYKKKNIFKNGNSYNDSFWLKYNTILPTNEEALELKKD
jgi:hypothetical protein